jgi:tRNA(Ile)-lysidine synthase TilS/MesJ
MHHLLGLFRDAARDELARLRVSRNLPWTEDETTRANGLRVRPDGRRRTFSFDYLPHYIDSLFYYSSNKLRILTEGRRGRQKQKSSQEQPHSALTTILLTGQVSNDKVNGVLW